MDIEKFLNEDGNNNPNIEYTKHDDNYDAIRFAAIAATKELARPALNCVNVTKDQIIGCDGFRLHIAPNTHNHKEGLFHVLKVLKTKITLREVNDYNDYLYPDVTQIMPLRQDCHLVDKLEYSSSIAGIAVSACIAAISLKLHDLKTQYNSPIKLYFGVNYELLNDVMAHMSGIISVYASISSKSGYVGPILIESDQNFEAIVMTIQRNNLSWMK